MLSAISSRRRFADLSEQEILALAISSEEDDASIYRTYAERLRAAGHGAITTEIIPVPTFYYAEDYHQQYLAKNPNGYCGLAGTGVSCPIGLAV